jgi:hypothetical protein
MTPERRKQLASDLRYERMPGIHTYHLCVCGKNASRGKLCAGCITELLTETGAHNEKC